MPNGVTNINSLYTYWQPALRATHWLAALPPYSNSNAPVYNR